jgi:hypothetical protein
MLALTPKLPTLNTLPTSASPPDSSRHILALDKPPTRDRLEENFEIFGLTEGPRGRYGE